MTREQELKLIEEHINKKGITELPYVEPDPEVVEENERQWFDVINKDLRVWRLLGRDKEEEHATWIKKRLPPCP